MKTYYLYSEDYLGTDEELCAVKSIIREITLNSVRTKNVFPLMLGTTIHTIMENKPLKETFDVLVHSPVLPDPHTIVIPRFRSIPFGKDLEEEVKLHGGELVNSYAQHRNIANIRNWVHLLRKDSEENNLPDNLTAEVFSVEDIPNLYDNEYFIKGETNSKKNDWFNSAYAENNRQVLEIVNNLMQDQYIGNQEIAIRPFQKFRQLGEAVDGRPVFNERRVFILDGKIVGEGYYWSSFPEWKNESDASVAPNTLLGEEYQRALNDAIQATKHLARFYVIDMAEIDPMERLNKLEENPDAYFWQVVELNDACMSGISEIDPNVLWRNVFNQLSEIEL